jgi:heptosyltransferase-2/heptosyltransferase-3
MKRLLIYFAGIGDLVVLIPLFRKLAADATLDLLTRPYGAPLFAGQNFVNRVHVLSHPNRGRRGPAAALLGGERRRLGPPLAREGYDEIFVFGQERAVITDWVETWRERAVVRTLRYPERHPDRVRIGLESVGLPTADLDPAPRLAVAAAEREAARRRLAPLGRRVVGVQAGSGPVNRVWKRRPNLKGLTPSQWAGLIAHVLESGGADAVVFHGTRHESREVRPILDELPAPLRARAHDWTGRAGLAELRALASLYTAMLSIDTGPAHIAAAVGCPLLVCFGPSDPAAYLMRGTAPVESVVGSAPCQFCTGTRLFKTCRENICLDRVRVDELAAAWDRLAGRIDSA